MHFDGVASRLTLLSLKTICNMSSVFFSNVMLTCHMLLCQLVAVRPLQVITNILIRSMGPVSEEDMVCVLPILQSVQSTSCLQHLIPVLKPK